MKVAVVKYNAGNIRSVDYALKRLGVEAVITADKEELQSADKVIFPGVGEAETTMNHLKATGLDELIKNLCQPVLGICLGMQLLATRGFEFAGSSMGREKVMVLVRAAWSISARVMAAQPQPWPLSLPILSNVET